MKVVVFLPFFFNKSCIGYIFNVSVNLACEMTPIKKPIWRAFSAKYISLFLVV
jgi:hypothetical protein